MFFAFFFFAFFLYSLERKAQAHSLVCEGLMGRRKEMLKVLIGFGVNILDEKEKQEMKREPERQADDRKTQKTTKSRVE